MNGIGRWGRLPPAPDIAGSRRRRSVQDVRAGVGRLSIGGEVDWALSGVTSPSHASQLKGGKRVLGLGQRKPC